MPRHTTGSPASSRGLRTSSEARSSIRRQAPVRLSRAAARECAARLMASGPALPVPRLAVGCLEPFLPSNTYSGRLNWCATCCWLESDDPRIGSGRRRSGRVHAPNCGAHCRRLQPQGDRCGCPHRHPIRDQPYISGWHEKEYGDPGRVFLAVEATQISIVYLRPTLELLGRRIPGCRRPSIGCCSKAWRPGSSATTSRL